MDLLLRLLSIGMSLMLGIWLLRRTARPRLARGGVPSDKQGAQPFGHDDARAYIRQAAMAAGVVAVFTILFFLAPLVGRESAGSHEETIGGTAMVGALFLALIIGLLRANRVCAILSLLIVLLNFADEVVCERLGGALLILVCVPFAYRGVRGSLFIQRERAAQRANEKKSLEATLGFFSGPGRTSSVGEAQPSVSHESRAWLDPRRFSGLMNAYALIMIVIAITEYLRLANEVLEPWIPHSVPGVHGATGSLVLLCWLVSPWLMSQAFIAAWLLLVAVQPTNFGAAAAVTANEALAEHRQKHGLRRNVTVIFGRIARPRIVSVLGWVFLVLPRSGAQYFKHHVPQDAERAFRAVINHELGHVKGYDDLLFPAWFAYSVSVLGLLVFGAVRAAVGYVSFGWIGPHLISGATLTLVGYYIIRRRESFCDTWAVLIDGSEGPTRSYLAALATDPVAGKSRPWSIHFDYRQRLYWLDLGGRAYLTIGAIELGILAALYFNAGLKPMDMLNSQLGMFAVVPEILDLLLKVLAETLAIFALAGSVLPRLGTPLTLRTVWLVGFSYIVMTFIYMHSARGTLSLALDGQLPWSAESLTFAGLFLTLMSVVPFVVFVATVRRWATQELSRFDESVSIRLVVGAFFFVVLSVTADRLPAQIFSLFLHTSDFLRGPNALAENKYLIGAPIGLGFVLTWALWVATLWSVWRRRSFSPARPCPSCGHAAGTQPPIVLECSRCGTLLRPDLALRVGGAS